LIRPEFTALPCTALPRSAKPGPATTQSKQPAYSWRIRQHQRRRQVRFFFLLVVLPGLLPCPPSSASRTRVSGTVPQSWPGCCSLGFGACARLVGHDAMPAQPQPPHQQACLPASLPGSPARPSIARAFGGGLMNKAHSHLPQTTIPLVRFGVGKIARSPLASNCKLPKQL
jgi:hypothetical protein